jgi:hypothetical protein
LRAIELLTINADKVTLQKQIVELTEKSKEENYIIKGKLADKEKEIELLNQRDSMNSEAISRLSDELITISRRVQELENNERCLS